MSGHFVYLWQVGLRNEEGANGRFELQPNPSYLWALCQARCGTTYWLQIKEPTGVLVG